MPDDYTSGADVPSLNRPSLDRASLEQGQKLGGMGKKGRGGQPRSDDRQDLYAALDLGTNNCRLLIARPGSPRFRVVDSYSKVVRLGAGLSATGRLSDESMDAAVEAIQQCSKKMGAKRVKRWRCVATQACRQATNGDYFLDRVKSETGIKLEVISARIEARLSVMGCMNLIDTKKNVVLVIDIGGGSTELSWVDARYMREHKGTIPFNRPPIKAWASLPVGVVTLSEQVPYTGDLAARYEALKDVVKGEIDKAGCATRYGKVFRMGKGHLIGTSGTITSLAALHLNLPFYQRDKIDGLWMKTRTAIDIARRVSHQPIVERAEAPTIGMDRANLLVAGCAILDVISEFWPSQNVRVADRGLREGILMGLINQGSSETKPKPNKKTPNTNTDADAENDTEETKEVHDDG